jgi:hypothetical protein
MNLDRPDPYGTINVFAFNKIMAASYLNFLYYNSLDFLTAPTFVWIFTNMHGNCKKFKGVFNDSKLWYGPCGHQTLSKDLLSKF